MKKILVFCLSFILLGVINVKALETTYNIKYNGNGATSGEMAIQEGLLYSKTYTLSSNKFARTGYSFNGWNKKADGSGRSYANKATVSKLTTKDGGIVNLYAQWLLKDYTITYELNGGVNNSDNPSTYNVESGTITLKEPTREGYAFIGWYKDSGLTSKVTKIASGSTGSKKFYAKWQMVNYSIEYNGNGNTSGEMSLKKGLKYGVSYTLNSNKFARTGYNFKGWNTKADGSGTTYVNKDTVSNLTKKNNAVVTLYAQWKPKTYTITYELNGGKNNKENPKTYTIETPTTLLKEATRDGYTFVGWYKDSGLTSKVTKVINGTTGNRTMYAKWRPNTYTIKYNGNGATRGSMDLQSGLNYDESYELISNGFSRDGYIFDYWTKKADGSGTQYTNKDTVSNLTKYDNGVVNMYAQWKLVKYTITYVLNGGANDANNPETYTVETTSTLKSPSKQSCTFLGWYTDKTLTKKFNGFTSGITGNITLYAKWKLNTPEIVVKNVAVGKINIASFVKLEGYTDYSDNMEHEKYFEIYRKAEEENSFLPIVFSNMIYFEDTDIVPGKTYYYKVKAYCYDDNGKGELVNTGKSDFSETITIVALSNEPSKKIQATEKAKLYLASFPYSRKEVYKLLKRDGFTSSVATYGADNSGANWKENALAQVDTTLRIILAFHKDIVRSELEYVGFTEEEIEYAISNYDWNSFAVVVAKRYLNNGISKSMLIQMLEWDGFSNEEAVYGANNCGANWNLQAVKSINAYLINEYGYSKKKVKFFLENDGYTDSQISYALKNTTVNWDEQAIRSANFHLNKESEGYSEIGLIEYLEYADEYTHDEVINAVNNIEVNWNKQAVKRVKSQITYSYGTLEYTPNSLRDDLNNFGFTADQIQYALAHSGISWKEVSVSRAHGYLSSTGLSRKTLIISLKETAGFNTTQAEYGADNCGADWNMEAVEAADWYVSTGLNSRDAIIEQLENSGFTHDQAVYGVDNCSISH